ncbi:uncharacterized protein LOC119111590 [Pollicipes pollicipes]|uniref:uncharacterized protein LOC119111590 n=1 Tax=Pollicipes pollicipes TaxID=41117 RepID=UPI001885718D|nr:uncharacterized protein LOC119111590 [Pollicipes pollicipes]
MPTAVLRESEAISRGVLAYADDLLVHEDVVSADKVMGHFARRRIGLMRQLVDEFQLSVTFQSNELGVALAYREAGHLMVTVSWTETACPATQTRKLREVAKIPHVLEREIRGWINYQCA